MIPASVEDYRQLARRRLPRVLFDYIDGGSYAEVTLARNVADFTRPDTKSSRTPTSMTRTRGNSADAAPPIIVESTKRAKTHRLFVTSPR